MRYCEGDRDFSSETSQMTLCGRRPGGDKGYTRAKRRTEMQDQDQVQKKDWKDEIFWGIREYERREGFGGLPCPGPAERYHYAGILRPVANTEDYGMTNQHQHQHRHHRIAEYQVTS
jgi:hypothetical protein